MLFKDLHTQRLLLKVIGQEDADFILQQFSNEEVNRFLFDAEPLGSIEQARELIRFYMEEEPRNQNRWILIKKDTGERIGTCGFHRWNRECCECELGYDLYPPCWGNGYMQEALRAVLRFARDDMGIKRVEAHIARGNLASIKAAQQQGFTDSHETHMEVFRGEEYPHYIYALNFD